MNQPTPTPVKESTEKVRFREGCRKAGLYFSNVNVDAVKELRQIQAEPVVPKKTTASRAKPSDLVFLGPLIQHGLASLREGAYRVTEKGAQWLAALSERGLA